MSATLKTAFPTYNGYAPKEGTKALPVVFDFSVFGEITFDLLNENTQGIIQFVQSVWVDNTDNPNPLELIFGITQQRIVVPANAHGMWPVITCDQTHITMKSTVDPLARGQVILMNVPMPYTQGGPVVVNVDMADSAIPVLPSAIDAGLAGTVELTETPDLILPYKATRKALMFSASENNISAIHVTIGGVTLVRLMPGQNWQSDAWVPSDAITAKAASGTASFTYSEFV